MSAIVFLGPTLDATLAKDFCQATILPPAKMGDVLNASKKRPKVIAIIDGYFEQTPAVWHKEILHALSLGIHVVGGGSMGALRAAEMHAFGMVGVGKIFEDFASGRLEDDDEVAVLHGDAENGFLCLSEAMVNIRYGLEAALAQGVIDRPLHDQLIVLAKTAYYSLRSWPALFAQMAGTVATPAQAKALEKFITEGNFNQKRDDAIETLRKVQDLLVRGEPPAAPTFELEHTKFWEEALVLCETTAATEQSISSKRIVNHLMAMDDDRQHLRERALLLQLVDNEAKRLNLDDVDNAAAMEVFRRRRGLIAPELLSAWIAKNGISKADCLSIARSEALLGAVAAHYAKYIDVKRLAALKLEGRFSDVVKRVGQKWEKIDEVQLRSVIFNNKSIIESAFKVYEERHGKIGTTIDRHAVDLGFDNAREFVEEMVAEYMN